MKNCLLVNGARNLLLALVWVLFLSACAATEPMLESCTNDALHVHHDFPGGNFHDCQLLRGNLIDIEIHPEDPPPINQSAWYAFRIDSRQRQSVKINIRFIHGYPRYWPKFSLDGQAWQSFPTASVVKDDEKDRFVIDVNLIEGSLWIAAQPLIMPDWYEGWMPPLASKLDLAVQQIGASREGRPINMIYSEGGDELVVLLGRQHPPEVTSAFAMHSYLEAVLGSSDLAEQFRQRFSIIIVPLINPDGVVHGHWRHNMGGVDLNRDWGEFSQPETQAVRQQIDQLVAAGKRPVLMLDFHSTRRSLFYTQLASDFDLTPDFATLWLNRSRSRLGDFDFRHDPRGPSGQANTKNYFFSTYDIPAITYEISDSVSVRDIYDSTPVFAEEMMKLLLEQ